MAFAVALAGPALLGCVGAATAAPIERTLCLFDPVGANGMVAQQFQDYLIWARSKGVDFKLTTYTDEGVVAKDLRARRCDAAGLTGIRTKQFVDFAGSLDMVGGLQTYAQQHTAIRVMASDKAADLMTEGPYAVAGVLPGGKVYLFSREKRFLDSLEAAAGKKVAVIGYDKQASVVANVAGASPVPASIASFGPMFNNHSVDMAYAPAIAYEPLELEHGITPDGGIANFVLGMLSGQIVVHQDRFDPDFGPRSRSWVANTLSSRMIERLEKAEARLPYDRWVVIEPERAERYRQMFRDVRQRLWQEQWYSHRMQRLLKKLRCNEHHELAECSLDTEGGPVY